MRIFVAFAHPDRELASRVTASLRDIGYDAIEAESFLQPGDDINKRIREELSRSDALVILWSHNSPPSHSLMMELGYFSGLASDRFVLPIVLDDTPLPVELSRRLYYKTHTKKPSDIAAVIAAGLSKFEGEKQQSKKVAEERKEEVERSAGIYISESLAALKKREGKYQCWALICYFLGYITLVIGVGYAAFRLVEAPPSFQNISQSIYASVITLTAIGFLGATARFTFVLGKSFMVESLRNHDRIHAIKFGEFYLKAFGTNATWQDLKEAFQHWNLDTGSAFKDQTPEAVDPQVLQVFGELVKAIKKS